MTQAPVVGRGQVHGGAQRLDRTAVRPAPAAEGLLGYGLGGGRATEEAAFLNRSADDLDLAALTRSPRSRHG